MKSTTYAGISSLRLALALAAIYIFNFRWVVIGFEYARRYTVKANCEGLEYSH